MLYTAVAISVHYTVQFRTVLLNKSVLPLLQATFYFVICYLNKEQYTNSIY